MFARVGRYLVSGTTSIDECGFAHSPIVVPPRSLCQILQSEAIFRKRNRAHFRIHIDGRITRAVICGPQLADMYVQQRGNERASLSPQLTYMRVWN